NHGPVIELHPCVRKDLGAFLSEAPWYTPSCSRPIRCSTRTRRPLTTVWRSAAVCHGHQVEQAPRRFRGEGHQDIDVAVGPKSSRSTDPKRDSSVTLQRRQKSAIAT